IASRSENRRQGLSNPELATLTAGVLARERRAIAARSFDHAVGDSLTPSLSDFRFALPASRDSAAENYYLRSIEIVSCFCSHPLVSGSRLAVTSTHLPRTWL